LFNILLTVFNLMVVLYRIGIKLKDAIDVLIKVYVLSIRHWHMIIVDILKN